MAMFLKLVVLFSYVSMICDNEIVITVLTIMQEFLANSFVLLKNWQAEVLLMKLSLSSSPTLLFAFNEFSNKMRPSE